MWYRVFCRSDEAPEPGAIVAALWGEGLQFEGTIIPGGPDWTGGELRLGAGTPVCLERFQTVEDDLRNDLNTWAAYLETLDYSPNHIPLMEHVIQTRQLFTVREPLDHANESAIENLCRALCLHLARAADGVLQVEGDGWYAADGALLLKEY